MTDAGGAGAWSVAPVRSIEDLSEVVQQAGFEPLKMARGALGGSLAHVERNGMVVSTGCIAGRFSLSGPLSADRLTLGLGLRIAPGSRHWLHEVGDGTVGIYHAGDPHTAYYASGAEYATLSLTLDRLEAEAARMGLVLDRATLGGTGIHERRAAPDRVARLARAVEAINAGDGAADAARRGLPQELLRTLVVHLGREPARVRPGTLPGGAQERIVSRAIDYMHAHLSDPVEIGAVAAAACTSERSLHRAFRAILDETPYAYLRTLRLNKARQSLVYGPEATVAEAATFWGFGELGRFAQSYRGLFGEPPSSTLRHRRSRPAWTPPPASLAASA